MRNPLLSFRSALCLVSTLASGLSATAFADEEDAASLDAKTRLVSRIPLNVPIRNFRLPQYQTPETKDGGADERTLVSLIEVGRLRRVSERQFTLEDVKIRLFEMGEEVRIITTPHARFHLHHQLLAGDHPVRVERPGADEPEATGRGFVYELKSKVWSLLSEVTTRFPSAQASSDPGRMPTLPDSSETP